MVEDRGPTDPSLNQTLENFKKPSGSGADKHGTPLTLPFPQTSPLLMRSQAQGSDPPEKDTIKTWDKEERESPKDSKLVENPQTDQNSHSVSPGKRMVYSSTSKSTHLSDYFEILCKYSQRTTFLRHRQALSLSIDGKNPVMKAPQLNVLG